MGNNNVLALAAQYLLQNADSQGMDMVYADSSGDWDSGARVDRDLRQGGRQANQSVRIDNRFKHRINNQNARNPMVQANDNLPVGGDMSRSDNRLVSQNPDGYTDPTVLVVIPDQPLATITSLSVTTPPPNLFYAAYLLLSVSAGAQALVSVSTITIGGIPMLQGAGAFGADALNPASFNVFPVRRIIETSQPVTISVTNNDAATRRLSAYFFGFLKHGAAANY